MAAGAAGYAANSPRTVVSTFTTTVITSAYDIQEIKSNVTTTKTTTVIEGGNYIEYNFTGNGTILEYDLLGLLENYTPSYAPTTHLQWVNNGTVFNFNATSASSTCMIDINNHSTTYDCSLILNGFGAAYFGNGQQWANSTSWVGTFEINKSSSSNVVSYFSALESFLSVRGLKPISTTPESLVTVTRLIVISNVVHVDAYTCGTESFVGGTAFASGTTSTEYVFPTVSNSTVQPEFLNVTITTLTSIASGVPSTVTDTTFTLTPTTSGNSTGCPYVA